MLQPSPTEADAHHLEQEQHTSKESPTLRQALLLIIITIVVVMLALEGFARIMGAQPLGGIYLYDPHLGWRWKPNSQEHFTSTTGIDSTVTVNRQGVRATQDYAVPKPDNISRLLILGDSVAMGQGVDDSQTFAALLNERASQQGLHTEVINGGTTDYNTQQEVIWLERYGLQLEPDQIILVYVTNDARSFAKPPFFAGPLQGFYNFLRFNSSAYGWYLRSRIDSSAEEATFSGEGRYRYLDLYKSGEWVDDEEAASQLFSGARNDWAAAWDPAALETNLQYLDDLYNLTQAHDVGLMLLIMPPHAQVAMQQIPTDIDFYAPQNALSAWADAHQIPVIDPLAAMRDLEDDNLYYDHIHLSEAGHAFIADVLFDTLFSAE
jgi:lysophospholipase L1-like esterase